MSGDFLEPAIAFITIGWFAWLLAWPFFVLANVGGWGIVAIRARRGGSYRLARWSAALAVAVLFDGCLVLADPAFSLLGGVPSSWRFVVQLGLLALPLVVGAAGLLMLGVCLWRSDLHRIGDEHEKPRRA